MYRPLQRPHDFLSPVPGSLNARESACSIAGRASLQRMVPARRHAERRPNNSTATMWQPQKAAGTSAFSRRRADFSELALVSSATTRRSRRRPGPQNDPDDFGRQLPALRLQTSLGCNFIVLDARSRLFNLGLRSLSRLNQGRLARLQRLLPKCLLILENRHTSLAQALFVFRSSRLGGSDIGTRLFDRSFSFAAPLGQNLHQRLVNQRGVDRIQQNHEDNSRYGSEQ